MSEISYIGMKKKYSGRPLFGDKTNVFENLIYCEIWFIIIGFGMLNHTEISVLVISVFTHFGCSLQIADYYAYLYPKVG